MVGLQILKRTRQVSAQLVEAYKGLPVANISDCMSRMTAAGQRLRPMHRSGYLAGPALTVKTRPGDNLMIHKALTLAQPGDVIVVDGGGDLTNALFGEIMVATAVKIGLAGIVLNGATMENLGLQVAQLAGRIKADKAKGLLVLGAVVAGLWALSRFG